VQRHVARDHIEKYGPEYYDPGVEKVTERIIESKTKKAGIKPIHHHHERPFNPMTDNLPSAVTRIPRPALRYPRF
jgi:hypothetical protein